MGHVALWSLGGSGPVGGLEPEILGSPRPTAGPGGRRALAFDGAADALLLPVHPLAGVATFTVEIEFRPDAGGLAEQRFLHLQEADSDNRILLETRLRGEEWFLDTFVLSGPAQQTLFAEGCRHRLGRWYCAAAVYDGVELRHYVDGQLELAGPLAYTPARAGVTSVGVRCNRVCWFKGAISRVRCTPAALAPPDLLRL
ncbi:MAG: LamG-like jellyroll fold domain-containing protein [Gemmatimonadota bacterium]